jgi:AAA15 family ATPase/GTPase
MPRIIAIELENFQSIKERTRINFGAITLLYGPNSAGKSSVFDALELFECIWDPVKWNQEKIIQMYKRWARNEKGKMLPLSLAIEYELTEDSDTPEQVWFRKSNWECKKPKTDIHSFQYGRFGEGYEERVMQDGSAKVRLDVTLTWNKNWIDEEHLIISNLRIALNTETVFSFSNQQPYTLETFVDHIDEFDPRCHFLAMHEKYGFGVSGLALPFDKPEELKDFYINRDSDEIYWGKLSIDNLDIRSFIWSDLEPDTLLMSQLARTASDITFYFGTVLGEFFRKSSPLVKADRRVPTPKEALTVIDPGQANWWGTSNFSPATPAKLISDLNNNIDPHYAIIARSAHAELLKQTTKAAFWGGEHAEKHLANFCKESQLVEYVNQHLESRLFQEKVYKIKCSSTLMVPIDLNEEDPWSYYSLAQPATVRLYLEDGEMRKTEFEDVGSGVPFVLPVLCAASFGGLIKVQQPELHLHPALQSSIADVFIEETLKQDDSQFIIETHSEHLLLRLLRRIRDTEKKITSSIELPLKPEDIAIYYFDPQVTGGTVVSRQLVTPLGDFYNDWPRGFFSDRDRDLFNV